MSQSGTIRVAFIGQSEEWRFHRERCLLNRHFQVQFAVPDSQQLRKIASQYPADSLLSSTPQRWSPSIDAFREVIRSEVVDLVFVDAEDLGEELALRVAADCLSHGKHVCIGFQAFLKHRQELNNLVALAAASNSYLFIPALHRWESQFLGIRSVIDSGTLGTIRRAFKASRQFAPESHLMNGPDCGLDSRRSFDRLWYRMLDELVQFVSVPDKTTAVWSQYAQVTTCSGSPGLERTAHLVVGNDCHVHLELCRTAFSPIESGWVLEGTAGGFADRKRYRASPDLELIDVPIEFPATNQNGFYEAIFATLVNRVPFPVTLESVQRVLELWHEIDRFARINQLLK